MKSKSLISYNYFSFLLGITAIWIIFCLLGAIPFYLSRQTLFTATGQLLTFADALFESASGFTTTGATIFHDVEALPRSILFWRAILQWLGGLGILTLIILLAPLTGTGGYQLFHAEAAGFIKRKFTPKMTANARFFFLIYAGLTLIVFLFFTLGGMNPFDAVCHAFSTVSTGGFSTKNGSIGAFNSPFIEWVCIVFIFIAGFNFNLIHKLFFGKGKELLKNSEAKAYTGIFVAAAAICAFLLFLGGIRNDFFSILKTLEQSVRTAMFQCVSILTTTGLSAAEHRLWHPLAQGVIFFLMFMGACSASAGGGIKIIRHVIMYKQAHNEMRKQINPRGVFSIQINGKEAQKDIVHGAAGFICLYLFLVMFATVIISISGVELFSSFNIGLLLTGNIGLGVVQGDMRAIIFELPAYTKCILSFIMIAGRLELWTIFTIFYWILYNIVPERKALA